MTDAGTTHTEPTLGALEHSLWSTFVSRAILPGQPVMVEVLAFQHHVSVPKLLRVLETMADKGLISRANPSGYFARTLLTKRELAEIYVVRNRLEPWLCEEAAKAPIADERAEELRTLASNPETPTLRILAERDTAFHELIGKLSGLTFASRAVDSLNSSFHIYRRLDGHSHAPASDPEHVAIAEAIITGDADGARTAMQKHLSSSSARLLALG
jgi:DNA-binding GntR family transcriptional regulator